MSTDFFIQYFFYLEMLTGMQYTMNVYFDFFFLTHNLYTHLPHPTKQGIHSPRGAIKKNKNKTTEENKYMNKFTLSRAHVIMYM